MIVLIKMFLLLKFNLILLYKLKGLLVVEVSVFNDLCYLIGKVFIIEISLNIFNGEVFNFFNL